MSKKDVTSLLLFAVGTEDFLTPYAERLQDRLTLKQYSHPIPALMKQKFSDGDVKWMFDFSDQLTDDIYDLALSKFMETHVPFFLDVISLDPKVKYYLSAQLSVDESLGAFEVKIPKVPSSLNASSSFEFSYLVWHMDNEDEAGSRGSSSTLQ